MDHRMYLDDLEILYCKTYIREKNFKYHALKTNLFLILIFKCLSNFDGFNNIREVDPHWTRTIFVHIGVKMQFYELKYKYVSWGYGHYLILFGVYRNMNARSELVSPDHLNTSDLGTSDFSSSEIWPNSGQTQATSKQNNSVILHA